jgi:anti-sigma regulatory factor (Ser/Thr protein kinase)
MELMPGGSEGRTWTRTLFPSPSAPGEARWFLWCTAGRGNPPDDMETAILLLSEIVSNAVRHGDRGRAIKLTVRRAGRRLRVSVRNDGRFRPPPMRRDEPGGWGLVLVQQLASRWGIQVGRTSVDTWFEL